MTTALTTSGLTKRYGSLVAVDGLDLHVRTGEVYGFLGPNGAGKTTTLRMLLGLVRPTAGSLSILGDNGRAWPSPALGRVGALIEGPAFYPYLSGQENLRALARRARVSRERVTEILELVDLDQRAKDRYATYSLGMKQRLGLAAALLKRPELLVLDEPTNGLDPVGMADMRRTIRRLAEDGCTVLLSSHLLTEVRLICDRVGIIHRGRLVSERPIGELGGAGRLSVRADPLERAQDKLGRLVGPGAVRRSDADLHLSVDAGMAPAINRALVAEGIAVSELRWHQPDLEEVFLELTEGNGAVQGNAAPEGNGNVGGNGHVS
ncbi:ABC transporter ATP-binding protein [Spirillospora sp. NPDC048819]|uniref:ABC transporter ATP-binding protein n=1 Tax=Spirillospora sp. NPDC048819 TaxID=3155268 RepID=UPI0033FB664C